MGGAADDRPLRARGVWGSVSRWAKLHAKVSDSYDFADAHARDPNAALLFLLALPQADVFGVLPGHPGLLRGKLCGLLTLTDADVEIAFGVLCECGLVRAYADSKGRPMYIIPGYEQHQDVRWDRVGRPEHDLPADWEPSEDFTRAVDAAPKCVLAAWMRDRSKTTPGVVPECSGLDVDVDVDTEEDTDTERRSAAPAEAVSADVGDEGQDGSTEGKPPRKRSRNSIAFEACLRCYSIDVYSMDEDAKAHYAKAMNSLVADTGLEQVEVWAEQTGEGTLTLGTGAKPERKVPAEVRKAITAAAWEQEFAKRRGNGSGAGRMPLDETSGRNVGDLFRDMANNAGRTGR
jgi:hypothetical protein